MRRRTRSLRHAAVALAIGMTALGACGTDQADSGQKAAADTSSSQESGPAGSTRNADHPNVLKAVLTSQGAGTYSIEVTMSSEYDSAQRYADGWRVLGPEGEELGKHTLGHDHASEQPFTRGQSGLQIPGDVSKVTVEGHDLENGYGGETVTVDVPS
ncbi:MAG: hypothetical protein ABIQ13_10290 [Pedococcus sp.]